MELTLYGGTGSHCHTKQYLSMTVIRLAQRRERCGGTTGLAWSAEFRNDLSGAPELKQGGRREQGHRGTEAGPHSKDLGASEGY